MAEDEEERAEAREVEKEGGVMAEDEEERAEAREVEKEEKVMYHCHQCGKNYTYMHKLKHHMTWLCKERASRAVEVEPRRELSSNIYHLPTIDESEEEVDNDSMKEEKGEDSGGGCELEPGESSARKEEEGDILEEGERCEKELNSSVTSGSVAPQVFCCDQCSTSFPSKSSLKNHRRRNCKGVEVIKLCDS